MEFEFYNIYSKELAQAILDFVTENKFIKKNSWNAYWNKNGKLLYFTKDKYLENYNNEDDPDEASSGETYKIIVFDDIVEVRRLFNCYEDESDFDDRDSFCISTVNDALEETSNAIKIIFGEKLNLKKYKKYVEKIYTENYQATLHADSGSNGRWEKSFDSDNIEEDYKNYGIFTSEEYNDFPYILNKEFINLEKIDTFNLSSNELIDALTEQFIRNIVDKGDISKIEIAKKGDIVQNETNFKKESSNIQSNENIFEGFGLNLKSYAEETKRLSNQMEDIINGMLGNEIDCSLTKKQEAILNYIIKEYKENNSVPTVREMCKDLGLSSTATVSEHIKNLTKKGYLMKDDKNKIIPLCDSDGNTL